MINILLGVNQTKQAGEASTKAQAASDKVDSVNDRIQALEKRIDSLVLFSQAIAEILEEKARYKQEELLKKIDEIDLRDGVKDGRMGHGRGIKCEKCSRPYNTKLNKCLYCGHIGGFQNGIIK
jgi:hypothetical protein